MYFPSTYSLPNCSSASTMTVQQRYPASSARPLTLILQTAPASQVCAKAASEQLHGAAVIARAEARSNYNYGVKSCLRRPAECRQPAASPRSAGTPPCAIPRFVHFDAKLEHIRWFYKTESPEHASRDPVFTDSSVSPPTGHQQQPLESAMQPVVLTAIRKPTPSFSAFEPSPVVLESVSYAAGSLTGTVKVHNLAFEKSVVIRMTRDHWKTVEDVSATFVRSVVGVDGSRPGVDRFRFVLPIDHAPLSHNLNIAMCVCYRVNNQEHWDNNAGANYLFKLSHTQPDSSPTASQLTETSTVVSADICAQDAVGDSVVLRKRPVSSFARVSFKPASPQIPAMAQSTVTTADTRRYMRYSEAKFSSASSAATLSGAGLPVFATLPWSTGGSYGVYGGGMYASDPHRSYSPVRSLSPVVRTGSPLASPHVWSSYPTTLLHC